MQDSVHCRERQERPEVQAQQARLEEHRGSREHRERQQQRQAH